jgi:hypothetical protein
MQTDAGGQFFLRIHLEKVYQSHRREPKKKKFVPPTRGDGSPSKPTLPPSAIDLQDQEKRKECREIAWLDVTYRYFTLMFSLMDRCEGDAPLKTTSFRCLQMHQKMRMMAVHISRLCAAGQIRDVHHSRSSRSLSGSQSSLSHRLRVQAQISLATTHLKSRASRRARQTSTAKTVHHPAAVLRAMSSQNKAS